MEMTLLSITVWFIHFLSASSLYFDTLPTNYTETPQITTATTKTNQEPKILINATDFSTLTTTTQDSTTNLPSEVHTQSNTTQNVAPTQDTTSLDQHNSSTSSQSGMMDDNVGVSNASNIATSHTKTSHTTVSTSFARLMPQNNETTQDTISLDQYSSSTASQNGMMDDDVDVSNASNVATSHAKTSHTTVSTSFARLTPQNNETTQDTTSLDQHNSSTSSQNGMMDDDVGVSNASTVATSHTKTSHTTVSTSFARLTPQNNETGTMSSVSYTDDGKTAQTADTLSDLLKSVSTVPWKDWTEKDDDRTKADEGNYETNSTQPTFANTNKETRGTQSTEGSYSFTSEHREEPSDTTANTISVSSATATVRNDWSTSQKTDIPMITAAYTTTQDPAVTDAPEYHTSVGGVNQSTQQNRFTNSTAHTERENVTGKDTPSGTTNYNNNSIITDVLTDATTNKTNKTDTESKVWPTCLNQNPESQSRRSTLVCFITVWTLAMTATIFLGITIFLWVRLSAFKKKMKRRKKGSQTCEKESLWANPKASVQERVEFWYVSGSTMEADRKQKDRKKQERMKRRGREQDSKENGLWIQPRVTVDDITDFWYANRRTKEERMQDILL